MYDAFKPLKNVALVALGPSAAGYIEVVQKHGSRHDAYDEVWIVNKFTGLLEADLIFHMDDFAVQEERASAGNFIIGRMLDEMRRTKTPILTSRAYDRYPSSQDYPLEQVLNALGPPAYFNNTMPYAVAYAMYRKVPVLDCFGMDYFWTQDARKIEKGKACTEYWLGRYRQAGGHVRTIEQSMLLDGGKQSFYGYDTRVPVMSMDGSRLKVDFADKEMPTAAEIEERYDHSNLENLNAGSGASPNGNASPNHS